MGCLVKHLILGFTLYSMGILKAQDSLSITDIENLVLQNSPDWQKAIVEWKRVEIDKRSFLSNFLPSGSLRYSVSTSWVGNERDGATSAMARVDQPLLDLQYLHQVEGVRFPEELNDSKKKQKATSYLRRKKGIL